MKCLDSALMNRVDRNTMRALLLLKVAFKVCGWKTTALETGLIAPLPIKSILLVGECKEGGLDTITHG